MYTIAGDGNAVIYARLPALPEVLLLSHGGSASGLIGVVRVDDVVVGLATTEEAAALLRLA